MRKPVLFSKRFGALDQTTDRADENSPSNTTA
jgi:hypothetical protein